MGLKINPQSLRLRFPVPESTPDLQETSKTKVESASNFTYVECDVKQNPILVHDFRGYGCKTLHTWSGETTMVLKVTNTASRASRTGIGDPQSSAEENRAGKYLRTSINSRPTLTVRTLCVHRIYQTKNWHPRNTVKTVLGGGSPAKVGRERSLAWRKRPTARPNQGLWGRNKRSNHGFHVLPPSVEVTAVSRTPPLTAFHAPRTVADPLAL